MRRRITLTDRLIVAAANNLLFNSYNRPDRDLASSTCLTGLSQREVHEKFIE